MTPKLENIRKQAEIAKANLAHYAQLCINKVLPYDNFTQIQALIDAAGILENVIVLDEQEPATTWDLVAYKPLGDSEGRIKYRLFAHSNGEVVEIIQRNGKPVITIPKDTK